MPGLVLREDQDGLATLTLNRPDKLNALNVEMFVELRGHVDRIAQETDRIGGLRQGDRDYVVQPVDVTELAQKIAAVGCSRVHAG